MSIQLVLSHYLTGLRERDELDALLPDLLQAMGHSVQSRAQVGVNQGGVDVMSTKANDQGETEVFLFVIKFGNVSRNDFYSSQQAILPSVLQASTEYIRNRLPEALRGLKKRIVLVSNGVLKQDAQSDYSSLTSQVKEMAPLCSLDFWGMDQLSPLIEQYLFDDALLLEKGKSDLRAALAGLDDTQASFSRFVRFVDDCLSAVEDAPDASDNTRRNRFHKRAAAAAMGWAVLLVWGESEGNQKPGVLAGEYLLLRLWGESITQGLQDDAQFLKRFETLAQLHSDALGRYYDRVMPSLLNRRNVLRYRPDQVLYIDLICDELGRLGTALLLLLVTKSDQAKVSAMHRNLVSFINVHNGCLSPVYDGQTIDISLAMAAIMAMGDITSTQLMVRECIDRFEAALEQNRIMPVDTDDLEDAMALHYGKETRREGFFQTTTFVPMLGTMAALLGDQEALDQLSDGIVPKLERVTLERWFPQQALQTLTNSGAYVNAVGVSRSVPSFRQTPAEEVKASLKILSHAAAPEDFVWHNTSWEVLMALSARLHRHPLPTWYLAKLAGVQQTAATAS
ncbi:MULTISPECIES: hypothetical protein [unclassified Pseudomonas]|uniref:hypothetical protein n=1 Tax=unclassified Pseudomonas TaxID=196821 RepID=UPI0021C6B53F|nr:MULTISPECIES: hypothetical protein [unclassified Pseudomonas]MCU1733858.1 hypothetical protein [Pseudomonas sp. 20P_3.2_Bac4]MCU1747412.1 hypothetical protein [Pseudomonas sp. 20P_3.2_Bac5]